MAALYLPEARTKFGSWVLTPKEVHDHPAEWFGSLDDYVLTRTFRAAYGDIIVSETTASYTIRAEGSRVPSASLARSTYWSPPQALTPGAAPGS